MIGQIVFLENIASKLEKIGQFFSSLNPLPSMPSVAAGDRKQFHDIQIVLNNKTTCRSLVLEIIDVKTPSGFL